jgi:hypothetical protein
MEDINLIKKKFFFIMSVGHNYSYFIFKYDNINKYLYGNFDFHF